MENQQLPNEPNTLDNFFNISFDEAARAQIRKAAQWARICVICTFIGYGLNLITVIFTKQASLADSEEGIQISSATRFGAIFGAMITVAIGVWINYFLYRFGASTSKGMDAMDSIKTNEGFEGLRRYFKILGIIIIVALSLAVLVILYNLFRL
jgi:hypothetical protein